MRFVQNLSNYVLPWLEYVLGRLFAVRCAVQSHLSHYFIGVNFVRAVRVMRPVVFWREDEDEDNKDENEQRVYQTSTATHHHHDHSPRCIIRSHHWSRPRPHPRGKLSWHQGCEEVPDVDVHRHVAIAGVQAVVQAQGARGARTRASASA